jgi:hypothetical protein
MFAGNLGQLSRMLFATIVSCVCVFSLVHAIEETVTDIEVHVYKIQTSPLWHSGIVVDEIEYYFHQSNRVEHCSPWGMDLIRHRTIRRQVKLPKKAVLAILARQIDEWNQRRYDLAKNNCNVFVQSVLLALGVDGLDSEYLDASGLAKIGRQTPGVATLQELMVKWPIERKQLDKAVAEDLQRFRTLPRDTEREIMKLRNSIVEQGTAGGKSISEALRKLF